jgi:hypothetical protein
MLNIMVYCMVYTIWYIPWYISYYISLLNDIYHGIYHMVCTIWYIPYGIYQLLHGIYHPKVVYTMRQPSRWARRESARRECKCSEAEPALAASACEVEPRSTGTVGRSGAGQRDLKWRRACYLPLQ